MIILNKQEMIMAEKRLLQELDKGWKSGEMEDWYSAENLRNHFEEKSLTKETVNALLEAERISKDDSVKGYHDLNELFIELRE